MASLRRVAVGRRLALALALTLGPTIALAWFGYRALGDRERSVRLSLTSSAALVRDRLVGSLAALDRSVARDIRALPDPSDIPAVQAWLRTLESGRPWLQQAFLTSGDGGVITADLWTDWDLARRPGDEPSAWPAFTEAETAEFVAGDLELALRLYRQAVSTAAGATARAAALTRVGRTLNKLNRQAEARFAYVEALSTPGSVVDSFGVPYQIIARAQLAELDGSQSFLQHVLDHPWDARAGYAFYLRRAVALTPSPSFEQTARARERLAATDRLDELLTRVEAAIDNARDRELVRTTLLGATATSVVSIARVTSKLPERRLFVGVALHPDHVSQMLADAVSGVELGDDAEVSLAADDQPAAASALSIADLGFALPGHGIAIMDRRGRTLSQLSARDRWTYGGLLGGVFAVLLAGVVFMTRAWTREAELARLRTDFVSNVSHELKTPLALIRMFGETLESGVVADASRRQEFYGIIRRESDRLTHLINNVLDAAKIEAGTSRFNLQPTDLVALVRDALDAYGSLFNRLDVELAANLPDEPISVRLDRDAVAQALVNLFQNAIRYAGDGRYVGIAVRRAGNEVNVAVADRGPGIPAGELPKIFGKFYRSHATAGSTAGSGLGLSIVKHVMDAHGGRVDVESVVGSGSVFTLVFPVPRSNA